MPFCPQCQTEYRQTVKACPECKAELVEKLEQLQAAGDAEDFVEIYTISDRMEVDVIRGLFEENQIPLLVRDMRVFPVLPDFGRQAELRLAVPPRHLEAARRLLEEARQDGALSEQGSFI